MSNEILIPVRRRHAATRTVLETLVTKAQHWGYGEDEDLILIRRSSGVRRYFSRSALCRPGTVYDPVVNVDVSNRVGINCTPNASWDTGATSILEFEADSNSAIATIDNDLYIFNGSIRKTDDKYYRLDAVQYPKIITGVANSWSFYAGATGLIDSEFVTSDVTTYNSYFGLSGTRFNVNRGDFDFTVCSVDSAVSIKMDGTTGNVGFGVAPDASAGINIATNSATETLKWQMLIAGREDYDTYPNAGILFKNKYLASGAYAASAGIAGCKETDTEDLAGYLSFYTRPTGQNIEEQARIDSKGNIAIGTITVNSSAVGNIVIANGVAPATYTEDQIYIFSKDVSNYEMDPTQTAATLCLRTEMDVITISISETNYALPIEVNGTVYYLPLYIPA